ncbi:hypothetical protein CQA66_05195 [Helicobacter aurati]|uniref:Uncharacterized protein n=1 Tax=Helicobacter aurati TaxID=137778 RepID=A0A3D8J555_9HELI|nr:hypothetical protein [Helicobacter aurati]RDU72275.1 hypothetical protein CQA66_05195 [Helicobacter aurati]
MIASLIMLHIYDKIPHESIPLIKDKLNKLDKLGLAKFILRLPLLRLYNIEVVFWIGGVLLGMLGIGRFMIGDKLIGTLKITLLGLSYCIMLAGSIIGEFTEYKLLTFILITIGYIGFIMVAIWWIVDIFLLGTKTRRKNLSKILMSFQIK